jgi:hypothetical protein
VFEAPAIVSGFADIAMVPDAIAQGTHGLQT